MTYTQAQMLAGALIVLHAENAYRWTMTANNFNTTQRFTYEQIDTLNNICGKRIMAGAKMMKVEHLVGHDLVVAAMVVCDKLIKEFNIVEDVMES